MPPAADPLFAARVRRWFDPLVRYHDFRVDGLDAFPRAGPVLLVMHHTFATYDGFMLGGAVWEETGRLPRGLGDDRLFQTPLLRRYCYKVGLEPASPDAGERLLREGHVLGVAPGGMWEALRPVTERRRSRWGDRRGFVRLALRAGAPMVFAACPAADELFTVYPSRLTDRVYERFHMPVPLVRGRGPSLVPRRVPLVGYFSPPLHPPLHDPSREDEQIDALRVRAEEAMAALLARR